MSSSSLHFCLFFRNARKFLATLVPNLSLPLPACVHAHTHTHTHTNCPII